MKKPNFLKKSNFWKYTTGLLVVAIFLMLVLSPGAVTTVKDTVRDAVFQIGMVDIAYAAAPDYTCDGADDDVQFQAALDALPAEGGRIDVLAGAYVFSATVVRAIDGVTIVGTGEGSFISHDGATPLFNCGAQTGWYFENLTLDAGGITTALASEYTYQNVWIGGTYYSYYTTGDFYVDVGSVATFIVAATDSTAAGKAQADYVCDGTSDEVQIQAAITALSADGGKVALLEGTYTKGNVAAITIPSNVEIELLTGATITFKTDVGADAIIFANADAGAGNSKISIIGGGTIDGNKANQAVGEQVAIKFTKVSNSMVDCYIENFCGRNIWEVTPGPQNVLINRNYPFSFETGIDSESVVRQRGWQIKDGFEDEDWVAGSGVLTWPTDSDAFSGKCMKMVTDAGVVVNIDKTFDAWDSTNLSLGYRVKILNPEDLDNISLFVTCPAANWGDYYSMAHLIGIWQVTNKWEFRSYSRTPGGISYVGYPKPEVSRIVRLQIDPKAGKQVTVWFDDFMVAPSDKPGGAVMFRFDDGRADTFTNAFPVLGSQGFPGVIDVLTSFVDTGGVYVSLEQLKGLRAAGWDVVSHSMTHKSPELAGAGSRAEIEDELRGSQSWLYGNGFQNGSRFFVYPGSGYDEVGLEYLEKYIYLALDGSSPHETLPIGDPYNIHSAPISEGASAASLCTMVDMAHERGTLLIFMFHGINDSGSPLTWTPAKLQILVDYIAAKGMDVITLSDLWDNYIMVPQVISTTSDSFLDINSSDGEGIVANEDMTQGTPFDCAIAGQTDVPRYLYLTLTDGNASISAFTILISGTNSIGETIIYELHEPQINTEPPHEPHPHTLANMDIYEAFTTVEGIEVTSVTGADGGDELDIGFGSYLGLSNPVLEIYKVTRTTGGAPAATATDYPVGDYKFITKYNTVAMHLGAGLVAGDCYTVYYTYIEPIQISSVNKY